MTVAAILLHGYHPYVVDGSIYVTGIKQSVNPHLYAADNAFVAAHARLSVFSAVMARLKLATGLPLDWLLLITYFVLVLAFLAAAHRLASKVFASARAGWGATLLVAACLPLPVAATSLLLVDPYLTARSFSTSLSLFAVTAAVEQRRLAAAALCLLAAIFHPLMGIYLFGFLLLYFLVAARRWRWIAAVCASAILGSAILYLATRGTPVTPSYREAVLSREYYFPAVWRWYEWVGLFAPLALLAATWRRSGLQTAAGRLAATCLLTGALCCLCAFVFAHPAGPYLLPRLQLLRSFHTIYAVGAVLIGGAIATRLPRRLTPAALAGLIILAAAMFVIQRRSFPTLPDVELPGSPANNPCEIGFLWIRNHTAVSAVFAIDPQVVNFNNEATPGFRAIAERSILNDVKDEGLASLFPPLAPLWQSNRDLERKLSGMNDTERKQQLQQRGVSWVILAATAPTRLPCPFRDALMQVCQVSQP